MLPTPKRKGKKLNHHGRLGFERHDFEVYGGGLVDGYAARAGLVELFQYLPQQTRDPLLRLLAGQESGLVLQGGEIPGQFLHHRLVV